MNIMDILNLLNIGGTFHSIDLNVLLCIPREQAFNGWLHTYICFTAFECFEAL